MRAIGYTNAGTHRSSVARTSKRGWTFIIRDCALVYLFTENVIFYQAVSCMCIVSKHYIKLLLVTIKLLSKKNFIAPRNSE